MTKLIVGLALLFCLSTGQVSAYEVPSYEGLVNDYANILSDTTEQQLEAQLQAVATSTNGAELAVVTITSLEGEPIEYVTQDFFRTWKIGKADLDNGVLLLVAVDDREVRIETGYGAETVITDSTAGSIIRTQITPAFREGDYDAGVISGVTTLLSYLEDPSRIPTDSGEEYDEGFNAGLFFVILYLIITFGIGFLSYMAAFIGRSKAWWPGGLIGLVLGMIVGQLPAGIFFGLVGLLLDYILSKNYHTWKLEKRATDWQKTMGGFRSSGGSSSSGSSGFSSFGGGSSGGGGASGRW